MNIVVTWPKDRALRSYTSELKRALEDGELAYYRVRSFPKVDVGDRCYQVHDGFVRGFLTIEGVVDWSDPDDCPRDSVTGQRFRPGKYVTRHPLWTPLEQPIAMQGFRGWRYYEETARWRATKDTSERRGCVEARRRSSESRWRHHRWRTALPPTTVVKSGRRKFTSRRRDGGLNKPSRSAARSTAVWGSN